MSYQEATFPFGMKVSLRGLTHGVVEMGVKGLAGHAAFEVCLMDEDGYMESTEFWFSGTGEDRARRIESISTKTLAVYVIPMHSTVEPLIYYVNIT